MVRYIEQIAGILRPGSVVGTGLDLRCFATYLTECHPDVRRHRGDRSPTDRGLQAVVGGPVRANKPPQLTPPTIAHRLGVLRMFFVRIDEWAWPQAPPRVPILHGDVPIQDHALPKALDEATASALLRAAQADTRQLVGLTVEFLLCTGLRVGEDTALSADAVPPVVLIGDTYWLHVPVGKLHDDGYLPCTPTSSSSSASTGPRT